LKLTIMELLKASRSSDGLDAYIYNIEACREKVTSIKRRQFLECSGLTTVGCRGDEAKVIISDRVLFDALSNEIEVLTDRATRIENMFVALDKVVERLDADLQTSAYSPEKMYGAISRRRNMIYDFERGLAEKAATLMGLDTFQNAVTGPENLGEVMKDDIAATKERIKKLRSEIDILTTSLEECKFIIKSAGADLLIPADEPEVVREKMPEPQPNTTDSGVMVY
jgi:hypothetical protein